MINELKVFLTIFLLSFLISYLYFPVLSDSSQRCEDKDISISEYLLVQDSYEGAKIDNLSTLNTFQYPTERVKLRPPFIKKINVFWKAVWVGHIDRPHHRFYNSIVFTPISARIILEGQNFAFHIKVMPYIGHSSDKEHSFVSEEMYFTREGESIIIAINPVIDFYFRFLNHREDQVLWVGGGLHSIYPVFETLLNIPIRKYRLQTGGGLIYCYGESLYMFSFNLETSTLYNSRYFWGDKWWSNGAL
ncbi:MAG: hypothetical protein ACUVWP_01380 [bacterium]